MLPTVMFFGSGAIADQIRSHLQDLAAMSLIRSFTWVDPRLGADRPAVRVCRPDGELLSVCTLDEALRDLDGNILLVALDPMSRDSATEFDMSAVQRWTSAIDARVPGTNPRVRVLLPRLPLDTLVPAPEMGWSTVAIAPEDSDAPTSSVTPVNRADDPHAVAELAASTLATLTGLWRSAERAPLLDDHGRAVSTGDGYTFRLVRAYHRTVDASEIESQVREQVFDVTGQLPLPMVEDGRQAVRMPDPATTSGQAADALINRYRDSLLTPPRDLQTVETLRPSAWAALKKFLGEFFRASIGTPQDWKDAQGHAINAAIAKAVQNTLYGQGASVDIVCGTYRGRFNDPGLFELTSATADLKRDARTRGLNIEDPPSLPDLWNGYRRVALMLVDGTNYLGEGFDAPRDNQHNPAIVEQGWMSVPDPAERFEGYHPQLSDILGLRPEDAVISPYDSHHARVYSEGLDFAVTQTSDRNVLALRDRFREWTGRMSTSFAWQAGERLMFMLGQAQKNAQKWRDVHQGISTSLRSYEGRDYDSENRRLTRVLRLLTGLWVLIMILIGYLTLSHYQPKYRLLDWMSGIDWRWALLSVFLTTVAVMGTQMFIFARARRGVLEDLNQMRLLVANEEISRLNSNAALNDVERLAQSYHQFLSWSTLLGKAIAQPLGRVDQDHGTVTIPTSGLPRTTRLGRAVLPTEELQRMVSDLRRAVFPRDWADRALTQLVDDAARELQHVDGTRITSVNELHGQAGAGSRSALDKLSSLVGSGAADDRDHSDQAWTEAISSHGTASRFDQRDIAIEMYRDGERVTVSRDAFRADLTDPAGAVPRFSNRSLNYEGVNAGATAVDPAISSVLNSPADARAAGTLTSSVSVIQFGNFTRLENLADKQDSAPESGASPTWEEPTFSGPQTTPGPQADTPTPDWDSLI